MKTLWDNAARKGLKERLGRVQYDTPARWGKMNAPLMVTHLCYAFKMAMGELEVKSRNLPLRYSPLKEFVIYVLPFPKGAPTAPELLPEESGDWAEGLADLRSRLDAIAARDPNGKWPEHPAFGKLSHKQWGVLGYKHVDHHLKQFGV